MKRSATGDQTLDMNFTDFERAAGGKKIKLNFPMITLNSGRANYDSKYSVLATDLIAVLQQNKTAETLMQSRQFNFSMNGNCQLTITDTSKVVESQI